MTFTSTSKVVRESQTSSKTPLTSLERPRMMLTSQGRRRDDVDVFVVVEMTLTSKSQTVGRPRDDHTTQQHHGDGDANHADDDGDESPPGARLAVAVPVCRGRPHGEVDGHQAEHWVHAERHHQGHPAVGLRDGLGQAGSGLLGRLLLLLLLLF